MKKNKISDVIARPQEIQNMFGDIAVIADTQDGMLYDVTADDIVAERMGGVDGIDGSEIMVAYIR